MGENTEQDGPPALHDIDGRHRLPFSVLTSWGSQCVRIISGFIVPRLIDGHIGQESLGVWDLAWSIVAYFTLVQAGIVSSINRYVALHRARGDMDGVNRSVSSVALVLAVMGGVIMALTIACSWGMPRFLGARLAHHVGEARWLILLLGTSLAVQVVSSAYGGVLTGCHRWDLHNALYAGCYVLSLVGMVTALSLGYGLVALGIVHLVSEIVGRVARVFMAHRVCPGLRVHWRLADRRRAREMVGFGGKTFVLHVSDLLLSSTTSIIIMACLGPAALAVYTRPRALIQHVRTFMAKYAFVLVPSASSLHGREQHDEVERLLFRASRYGAYLCLPLTLTLIIMGGQLLQVWMGAKYREAMLIALLALGHLAYIGHMPLLTILSGLNLHGRPGIANLFAACAAVLLTFVLLAFFGGGLIEVAIAVGLPFTLVNGVYLPLYTCRELRIPVRRFLVNTWGGPLACSVPFAFCLLVCRWLFSESPGLALFTGGGSGGIILVMSYWRHVIPEEWKKRLTPPWS